MKWSNIFFISLSVGIIIFLFFYGKVIYQGITGGLKLYNSEGFQNILKSEGFQNIVKTKDYKNIKNIEEFKNFIKEGFTSGPSCSTCNKKEGFQVSISDITNIDIPNTVSAVADQHNLDIENIDTTQITPTAVVQKSTTITETTDRPDINNPDTQCIAYNNQMNLHINMKQVYRDKNEWSNVRRINSDISSLREKINELGCASNS